MKYLRNLKIILPIIIVLVISSLASMYYFGINVGTDYDPGIMVTMYLNDETSMGEIESTLKGSFDSYERIEQVGGRYEIYFINSESSVTSNDLKESLEQSLKGLFENHGEITAKEYTSTKLAYLDVRLRDTGMFLAAIFAVFGLVLYKNNNLRLDEILSLLLVDYLVIAMELIVLFGGIALAGQLNVFISSSLVTAIVFIIFIALVIKIFASLRFDDFLESHKNVNVDATWAAYIDRDWPTIVFVLAILIIVIIAPMSVLGIAYIPVITGLIVVLMVAFLSEVTLKQNFLKTSLMIFNRVPGLKLLRNKKW